MDRLKSLFGSIVLCMAILIVAFLAGCGGGHAPAPGAPAIPVTPVTPVVPSAPVAPTMISVSPTDGAKDVPTSTYNSNNVLTGMVVTATFSEPMNSATINSAPAGTLLTFTLKETNSGNTVDGTVAMDAANKVATFTPASALNTNTSHTATVTVAAQSAAGVAMVNPSTWTFTTKATPSTGQLPVDLKAASTFAILTKTGITNVPTSKINGDVGTSPISGAFIGLTCAEVATGKVYSVDAAGPLPCTITDGTLLTAAIANMETAYTDAAGRVLPDFTELGAGNIGGLTLVPGLYKWGSDVLIPTDLTLAGSANDVWIFQIAGKLTLANATNVTLIGGALSKNVFWQSAGDVAIGTTAHFEGIILTQTKIAVNTGASVNGRLFAQTAVTLQQDTVTQPAN